MTRTRMVMARAPWVLPLLFGGMLAVALAGAGLAYQWGREHGIVQAGGLGQEYAALVKEYEAAQDAIAGLREDKAVLARSGQVERQAHKEVGRMMRDLQAELLEVREELAFYRGIIAPEKAHNGLRVKDLHVEATPTARVWRYRMILTQALRNDSALAQGKVTLRVHGIQDEKPRVLSLARVSGKGITDIAYRFRYFQNLDGELSLPEGFAPRRTEVIVTPSRGRDPLTKMFDWPAKEDSTHVAKEQKVVHQGDD